MSAEDKRTDSSEWRYISGDGYEGMAIPTEGFPTNVSMGTRLEGPPPTDEEIAAFEARLVDEIVATDIESVDGFEDLSTDVVGFKRYYFPGVNEVRESVDPSEINKRTSPQLISSLNGKRVLLVELARSGGHGWKEEYQLPAPVDYNNSVFAAIYFPETDQMWLEFYEGDAAELGDDGRYKPEG